MDWEILEITKETSIKEQVKTLYQTISRFQAEIIADLHPLLIRNETFLEQKNWWYIEKEGLYSYTTENTLIFVNSSERANYVSFKEQNISFVRLPRNPLEFLPYEQLKFSFDVETSRGVTAKFVAVEYDELKKEKVTFISLEKEQNLVVGKTTKYLRLALKISGKGFVKIKKIVLERVVQVEAKSVERSQNPLEKIKQLKDLKVACIFDEFTMTCYQQEVELISFTPDNWKRVLTENPPHVLFVESAWHGNEGSWQYRIGKYSHVSRDPLFELLKWCKSRKIPTVFWNKEDPIHFDKFIDTASRFDYIYTSDANKIADYKKCARHERVFALPFAAAPSKHNPIQLTKPREDKICFAGSYYANRHPERRKVMDEILAISQEFGLVIYDRNYDRPGFEFRFPRNLTQNIIGSLPYSKIEEAYKGYRFMLNVNSVVDSPTMFSRRVFEGLASGTLILSSYSKGIEEMFGQLVLTMTKSEDLRNKLKKVKENPMLYRKITLAGIREVYGKHTYKHRLQSILKNMGISLPIYKKSVTIMQFITSENEVKEAICRFEKQTYPHKKLALFIKKVTDFPDMNRIINQYQSKEISICLFDYMNNYTNLQELLKTDFATMWNPEHFYGRYYLEDLMLASLYTDADFIGKSTFFEKKKKGFSYPQESKEYIFVSELQPMCSLVSTTFSFQKDIPALLESFWRGDNLGHYIQLGAKMFSSDGFNFIANGQGLETKLRAQVEI